MSQGTSAAGPEKSGANAEPAISVASLIIRLAFGIVFLGHALQKLGWFEGGNYPTSMSTQADFVEFFGYSQPDLMAWLVTITEAASGLLLLLGFLTPLAVAGVVGITFQFIAGPQWSAGLFGNTEGAGGFEFTLAFLAPAVALGFIGAGKYSLDNRFLPSLRGVKWGLIAVGLGVVVGTVVLVGFGVGLGGVPTFGS